MAKTTTYVRMYLQLKRVMRVLRGCRNCKRFQSASKLAAWVGVFEKHHTHRRNATFKHSVPHIWFSAYTPTASIPSSQTQSPLGRN